MTRINPSRENDFFNHIIYPGSQRMHILESSWAEIFRHEVMPRLPAYDFSLLFGDSREITTKDLFTVLGTVILQQIHDHSDDETVSQLCFNTQWHYALIIREESEITRCIQPGVLRGMRDLMVKTGFDRHLLDRISSNLSTAFNPETFRRASDLSLIKLDMRRAAMTDILLSIARDFTDSLRHQHFWLYRSLPDHIRNDFNKKNNSGKTDRYCMEYVRPSDSGRILQKAVSDISTIIRHFDTSTNVNNMASYKLMLDMISKHDLITGKETSEKPASSSISEHCDIFSDLPGDLSAMLISRKNHSESFISVNDNQHRNDSHKKKGPKESEKKVQTRDSTAMTGETGSSVNSTTEQGTIRWFNRDGKLFGYIETDEGKEIYFDDTSISPDLEYPDICIGLRVSFHTETKEIGQMACGIRKNSNI